MRQARTYTSYLRKFPFPPFERFGLKTNDTISNEVFSALEYYSEVEEVGCQFLKLHGRKKNIRNDYLQFQAYIRQAKIFYNAAEVLDYRASSLIFYYSFLNLVKAFIFVTDPNFVDRRMSHGMGYVRKGRSFTKQAITTHQSGVMPRFYSLSFGETIKPKTSLKIVDLLGYCSDVALEYGQAGFGQHKLHPFMISININKNDGVAFPLISIGGFRGLERFQKSLKDFHKYFEEVKLETFHSKQLFDLLAEDARFYGFFESRKRYALKDGAVIQPPILLDVIVPLRKFISFNPYMDQYDCILAQPFRLNHQILMNEVMAIYINMFFLGSLVRYQPAYLESIFASRNSWIMERFVKSAPSTFLRRIGNLIHGRNYVYVVR